MLIQVNPHRIVLNKTNEVNSGEYNVNECTFEFSQEYEGLTKVAVFSLCDGTTRNITILNNRCIIPTEVLQETGQVQIGVYGYATQDNELVLRYSPTPQNFVVRLGSYKEGTEPVAPTPTDWEILVEQVSDIAEDVSSIHEDISGINGEISGINTDIRDLQDTKANISDLATVAFTGEFSDLKNIPSYATTQQLNQEIQDRQDADVNLQSQIDAISVSSDVVDVVGTYQELVDYDTQHLKDNDIVKVLQDSTHNNALSYYRWDKETSTWSYVGSEGPFYTKSETVALLNDKQDVIDIDNMLSSDLVDDTNSTNKFVTQADINNWNNKEDKSNKVTEINSSSTDTQYPSAKCVYDSQEEQNEQIAELEMLYNAFPTVSAEDTTIQLDNTAKVKFREIDLKGNTSQVVIPEEQGTSVSNTSIYVSDVNTDKENTIEMSGNTYQETTTGKNIFQAPITPSTSDKATYTKINDNSFSLSYTQSSATNYSAYVRIDFDISKLKTNTTYTLSKSQSVNGTSFTGIGSLRTRLNGVIGSVVNVDSITFTTPSVLENVGIYFYVAYQNTTTGTSTITFENIQLEENSTATSFEPYTYGASPNPDYPQNIEVVTGTQNVDICGKNLFNVIDFENDLVSGKIKNDNGIEVSDNTSQYSTYFIPVIANQPYYFDGYFQRIYLYNSNKEWVGRVIGSSGTSRMNTSYTPTINGYIQIQIHTSTYNSNKGTEIISLGSTATTYEQYQGTTYPVNLGNIELCKISTYQDRIYKRNDKWYLEKYIEKNTVNGTETWLKSSSTLLDRFILNVTKPNMTFYKAYSNYFINTSDDATTIKTFYMDASSTLSLNGRLVINFSNYGTTTLEQFKTWLSNNNVNVYFVPSDTPTSTEITDTSLVNQLNALYNATIYPITNINTDTSNLLPYIDLHYNFVTPSPSPSRPSNVNVVKGNNTITISNSDNTESQVFPINLGDMELCKIGTYQDYIYESNGNWFKKGNIDKIVLDGSENWVYENSTSTPTERTIFRVETFTAGTNLNYISNRFIYNSQSSNRFILVANNNKPYVSIDNNLVNISTSDSSETKVSKIKTFASSNNMVIYYILTTPTDTQITDTTLITQLNNIKKAYSYDTQTNISQTNEDKPFIIYAEAIRSLKDVFE